MESTEQISEKVSSPNLEEVKDFFRRPFAVFFSLYTVVLALIFYFNFLGTSSIKYFLLAQYALTAIAVLAFPWKYSVVCLFGLLFTEGQGRILFHYASWARLMFDFCVMLGMIKGFISVQKFFPTHKIPTFLKVCIGLHFLWYLFQFFNPYTISYFIAFAGMRIYIYPFILFFFLLHYDQGEDPNSFKRVSNFILFFTIAEMILCAYQMNKGSDFIFGIDSFYRRGKGAAFAGAWFRPWGTTAVASGFATYMAICAPLIYLVSNKKTFRKIAIALNIVISIYFFFICQTRSQALIYIFNLAGVTFTYFIYSRKKFRYIAFLLLGFSLVIGSLFHYGPKLLDSNIDVDYQKSLYKFSDPFGTRKKSGRLNFEEFLQMASRKLIDHPTGLGPGRTGPVLSLGKEYVKNDPIFNLGASWHHENLGIMLIIDLGIGVFFLLGFYIGIPLALIVMFINCYARNKMEAIPQIGIAATATTSMILANWGAPGINYNPSSFVFMFTAAMGLNAYHRALKTGGPNCT